jgi:hypothetical protein
MPRGSPKGNPNPSPETRFGGPRGNAPGVTSEQREAQIRNAWIVTDIHTRSLERLKARLEDDAAVDAFLGMINLNSLLKDAADRGFGTPKASVDVTNSDGSLKQEAAMVADLVTDALTKFYADD